MEISVGFNISLDEHGRTVGLEGGRPSRPHISEEVLVVTVPAIVCMAVHASRYNYERREVHFIEVRIHRQLRGSTRLSLRACDHSSVPADPQLRYIPIDPQGRTGSMTAEAVRLS